MLNRYVHLDAKIKYFNILPRTSRMMEMAQSTNITLSLLAISQRVLDWRAPKILQADDTGRISKNTDQAAHFKSANAGNNNAYI